MADMSATDGVLAAVTTALVGWTAKLQFRPDPRIDRVLAKLDEQNAKHAELAERLARIEGRLEADRHSQ